MDSNGNEFCPRCQADLTLQKGYDNHLPYWICKGCGEMLINPAVESESDIAWICDQCESMLNIQPGFREDCGEWKCTVCGFVNRIAPEELYATDDEYRSDLQNPFRGMPDEAVMELSLYQDVERIHGKSYVTLVRRPDTGKLYVRKILMAYDGTVFSYLKQHPVAHMPRILELFEGQNNLVIVEEYIDGQTLDEILEKGLFPEKEAVSVIISLCRILDTLHTLPDPIVHRDIKPSNVMIRPDGEVILLDMNIAKWIDPDQTEDTRYMGTPGFAAPEQVGFGKTASIDKTDIYAVGILLNVMLTGEIPKEKKVSGKLGEIIEHCTRLEAAERYTAKELIEALESL